MDRRIARRYAKALIQLVVQQPPLEAPLQRDLERFCQLYESSEELRGVLTNPGLPTERRDKVLQSVLDRLGGIHPMARSFFRLLLRNQRIEEVPAVRQEFVKQLDERAGRVRARVVTASTLDPMSRTKLQKALEQLFQKTVLIDPEVDPGIMAGVVTRVGHVVFDGSLRAQLERLREHLAAGN